MYRLLRQAEAFRHLLDAGEVETRADLARRMGVSRARVTQVMDVWRLQRPVVEHLRAMAARGRRATSASMKFGRSWRVARSSRIAGLGRAWRGIARGKGGAGGPKVPP